MDICAKFEEIPPGYAGRIESLLEVNVVWAALFVINGQKLIVVHVT